MSEVQERYVPQELVDLIIDQHRDDLVELRNLSLVCHAWVPSARQYVFNTITISPSYRGPKNLTNLALIFKAGPSACSAVRHLKFSPGPAAVTDVNLTLEMLTMCLLQFPRLQSLVLHKVNISGVLANIPSSATTPYIPRPLERLQLEHCRIQGLTWQPLLDIISLFNPISDLHLVGLHNFKVEERFFGPLQDVDGGARISVHSLHFVDITDSTAELIKGIVPLIDVKRLQKMAIGHGIHLREVYSTFLSFASSNLKEVKICIDDDADWGRPEWHADNPKELDLSSCKTLDSIVLAFQYIYSLNIISYEGFDILETISASSAHTLTRITLLIYGLFAQYTDSVTNAHMLTELASCEEWQRLGGILGRKFPSLRSVVFCLPHDLEEDLTVPVSFQQQMTKALAGASLDNGKYVVEFQTTE